MENFQLVKKHLYFYYFFDLMVLLKIKYADVMADRSGEYCKR